MHATKLSVDLFLRDIGPEDITPHFQPIIDLFTASVTGYETLSRGRAPFESPSMLFTRARQLNLTRELEHACHTAALERIADLLPSVPACRWFLNISPEVFCEETQESGTLADQVRGFGIDPAHLVFEITEHETSHDPAAFQKAVRLHARDGFQIAIDDFGAGTSGLVTLASCMPQVIKMDMELTRNVNAHPYKQNIARAIVSLAASVDATLIAEGVESWQELDTLVRQGVRFAQGHLFGYAEPEPPELRAEIVRTMRGMRKGATRREREREEEEREKSSVRPRARSSPCRVRSVPRSRAR